MQKINMTTPLVGDGRRRNDPYPMAGDQRQAAQPVCEPELRVL